MKGFRDTVLALAALAYCVCANGQVGKGMGVRGSTVAESGADSAAVEAAHIGLSATAESLHYKSHHPRWQSFALPAGVAVASSLFATNGFLRQQRNSLQEWLDTSHKTKTIDNYIQYSPIVGIYGLKALGVRSEHRIADQTLLLAMSALGMAIMTNTLKYTVREPRPDGSSNNSFPSGHTATAFMGAEILFQEYRDVSPWIGYGGYIVAAGVGCLRVYNNRHWVNDIVAGACIGIASAKLAYWLYPKIFTTRCDGGSSRAVVVPQISGQGCAVSVALTL